MLGNKKTILLLVVVTLSVIGYTFSPPSHIAGTYQAKIIVHDPLFNISLRFSFDVYEEEVEASKVTYINQTILSSGSNILNVTILAMGFDKYMLKQGVKVDYIIRFYVNESLYDVNPVNVESVVKTPNGNLEQGLILIHQNELTFRFALRYKSKLTMSLFLLIAALWLTEIIPLVAAAILVPVVAVILGMTTPKEALAPLFDPVIALFLGGFLLARAMSKYKLDKRLALSMIARTKSPTSLIFVLMIITAFLSFWMSNTAVAALMIPIALALLKSIEEFKGSNYGKAIILAVAYSATIGGMGTIIGSPPNAIAVSMLRDIASVELSFLGWMLLALPFTMAMLVIAFIYLYKVFNIKSEIESGKIVIKSLDRDAVRLQLMELGPMKKEEKITVAILIITIALWMTQKLPFSILGWKGHGISSGIIALLAGVSLFSTNVLESKDLNKISWETLLIFGGGIVLGNLVVSSGISEWIVINVLTLRDPFIVMFILGFLSLIVTAFASNTASAVILIPLAIPLGAALGINPVIPAVIVALASSTDFALPIGTPPTMLAYSTGYFKFREMVKIGFLLMIIGILILTLLVLPLWMIYL